MDCTSVIKRGWQYLIFLSFALSGCMVGPNFHTPKSPDLKEYNAKPLPSKTASTRRGGNAGISEEYIYGRDIPADWWEIYHSELINSLVRTGIKHSPTLEAAQAALRQAQENLNAQIGNLLLPAFDAEVGGTRQRVSGLSFGNDQSPSSNVFNLFNVTAKVAYTLDVFGGSRRQVEAARAQVDYQQFQVLATYLTLTSNIVTTAFRIASYEAQIEATKSLIQSEQGQLDIMRKQFRFGGIAYTNVLTQQTLVDQTRATLPQLQKNLSIQRHALATLIGDTPDTDFPLVHLNNLKLPREIPVSLPSDLVRQRPDIRAAEAQMHAASAQIGVATANLFPQFNITGNYGYISSVPSSLFKPLNNTWAMGMNISQPLFHGGALLATRRQAIAAFDQAMAQYKDTLLQAFQNTADALRAIETDARTYRAAKAAEIAARDNMKIVTMQYRDGGVAYLNLLNAQQQYWQTRLNSIQAQAQRYADTASLYQALGGGWWNRICKECPDKLNPVHASLKCP